MIQETVPSAKEYPISFDLGPISNICASSLRKMQKKASQNTNTNILELTSKLCIKKQDNLKMAFGWLVHLEEKFDP